MAGAPRKVEAPKRHSAFVQTLLRKSGEAMDLGGKALIGLSGLNHVLGDRNIQRLNWWWFAAVVAVGGAAIVFGIYLQAKAEETI